MVCFHNRYNLGDNHDYSKNDFKSWDELEDKIRQDHDVLVMFPLYLYDHSGITISVSPFSCQWDSGQVGFIFASRENLKKCGHNADNLDLKEVEKWLIGEVKTYDQFLTGEVYQFDFLGTPCPTCGGEGESVETCGGFYGSDPVENGMIYHLDKKYREEFVQVVA